MLLLTRGYTPFEGSSMFKGRQVRIFVGMLAVCMGVCRLAEAQVAVSITVAPPPLPVYVQPEIPAPGYIWTPGYWSYGPDGYFWVPGTWVEPPTVGLLWTPGYWGWSEGLFVWNAGYWGPQIGFYGGVNYGFGYPGRGYEGGYWRDNRFYYNRTVNNITNVQVTNVYTKTVINNVTVNHVSYTGGPGGIAARPTAAEQQAARAPHTPPTSVQTQHRDSAASHHELLASVNQGRPPIAATAKPNDFSAHVVNASRAGGPLPAGIEKGPATTAHPATQPGSAAPPVHARDLPAPPAPARPPESATAEEKNYALQQSQLQARQNQEREALAQQQARDHANLPSQGNNSQALAAMERQHQQQTQQLQQRHGAEQQQAQRAAPPPHAPPAHEQPH
jgi:YXWGXW repeat-containing protein